MWISGRDDPAFRRSTAGLAVGTAIGVSLLAVASLFDGAAQGAIWIVAIALDFAEPYLFGSEGWKLEPGHFAERHGLIMIIALGESIVAIGVGANLELGTGMVAAAVVGIALISAMWWLYFDVVAIVAAHHLSQSEVGQEQNEMARDSYSYIHFPMIAGVSWLRSASRRRSSTPETRWRSRSRWRWPAASRSTCLRTSRSGCGTCAR